MAYSSVDSVGRDIYGFLDFLSRRQGPKDSTNPQPPEPPPQPPPGPQVASADATGGIPGAGLSYPGTMSDADPQPFVKPLPVSSKPVMVADAAPAPAAAAAATPPKPVVPAPAPAPAAAAPALTSDQGTVPGQGAAKLPSAFDPNAPKIPMFDPSSGKIDVMGILKQQQDAANRRAALEGIARGGTLMAAAATRSPSMRQVLAHAAGTGGSSGSSGAGSGELNAATLLELDKRSRAEAAAGYKAKIAPALAKHLGVPPEMIQFMDDDKIATLTTAIAKGENLKREERADGSVFWTNMTTGETYGTLSPDQIKVQKAADEHAKSTAETGKIGAETQKIGVETTKLTREVVRDQNLQKAIPQIAARYGLTEDQIRQHYEAGTLDDFMKERDQESPDYKQWRELRTQEKLEGKPDDKLTPYSEYLMTMAATKSPTGGPSLEVFKTLVEPRLKAMGDKVDARLDVMPSLVRRLDDLKNNRLAVGPIAGSDWFRGTARMAKEIFGDDIDISKVEASDATEADLQSVVAATLKRYGVNPTDKDAERALKEIGDPKLTQAALERITRIIIKRSVAEANKFNDTLEEQSKVHGIDKVPGYQAQLGVLKRGLDGNYTEDMFEPAEIENFRERLKPTSSDPAVNARRRAELLRLFDKQHGHGMSKYLLTQNPSWLPD